MDGSPSELRDRNRGRRRSRKKGRYNLTIKCLAASLGLGLYSKSPHKEWIVHQQPHTIQPFNPFTLFSFRTRVGMDDLNPPQCQRGPMLETWLGPGSRGTEVQQFYIKYTPKIIQVSWAMGGLSCSGLFHSSPRFFCSVQSPYDIPFRWLVNRDPFNWFIATPKKTGQDFIPYVLTAQVVVKLGYSLIKLGDLLLGLLKKWGISWKIGYIL